MQTALSTENLITSNSNNNLSINSAFENSYLKSSKNYISSCMSNNNDISRPRVVQWDPEVATENSTITVILEQAVSDTSSPTLNDEIHPMKLVFGCLVVETSQQQQRAPTASANTQLNSQLVWITLVANVPKLSETKTNSGDQVPVSICSYDRANQDTPIDHWEFGTFTYNNGFSGDNGLKRKASNEFDELPNKKVNTFEEDDQIFNQLMAPFADSPDRALTMDDKTEASGLDYHHDTYDNMVPSISQASTSSEDSHERITPPMASKIVSESISAYAPSYNNMMFSQASTSASIPSLYHQTGVPTMQMQQTPMVTHYSNGTSYVTYSNHGYNHDSMYGNYYQPQSSMFSSSHPPLQPSLLPSPPHHPMPPPVRDDGSSHLFASVLNKATLRIAGNLTSMTENWTREEWCNGRRLVQFWRKQIGRDQVECGFDVITQEAYQHQRLLENLQKDKKNLSLVVSCIYWKHRNEFFITSVDCILLLEGLIGVQFTVEEKNRIRRNLEGFKPLTISKCKPESSDYFRLIMGYPHPKPRNIEKDVKVFSWNILANALKKIIRKYTPSYSSTAAVHL